MGDILRRRAMMVVPSSPTPPSPSLTLLYELESPTTTANTDTGIKLFDPCISFTILCEANFANRGWSNVSNTSTLFGVGTSTRFRVGAYGGNVAREYLNGEYSSTAKRYTALVMNSTGDSDPYKMTGLIGRMSTTAAATHRLAVRYDAANLKVEGFVDAVSAAHGPTTTRWFNVDSNSTTSNTLKLLNSSGGTMNIFRVYEGLMDGTDIQKFIEGVTN